MYSSKKLAVIMSLYKNDRLDNVKLAVESILNQTFRDFDFYIQFDGPIDVSTEDYLRKIKDRRVMVNERNENKGLAISLNELLSVVQGYDYSFIARMDADDISILERFEKQIAYLQKHPEVDIVGGAINEIDEKGYNRGKVIRYPCEPDECYKFFAKRNPVAHPTAMFRRSFFEKAGWSYPTEFVRNEDTCLWLKGYKHGCKIANVPDVVLNFRMTDNMFRQRRNGKIFAKSQLELRKKIAKELEYGPMSFVYAYAMYILMISPSWLLKLAYKVLR